jgi:hypothetical protein
MNRRASSGEPMAPISRTFAPPQNVGVAVAVAVALLVVVAVPAGPSLLSTTTRNRSLEASWPRTLVSDRSKAEPTEFARRALQIQT